MKHRPKRFYGHMNAVIAQMIRELYFSRHMNQTQLADFFRIKQGSVSRIISGQVWRRN
jgi:predicted XRE-type DNA-binding protein